LIAYVAGAGVGVLDPVSGKSTIVAPLPPGAFRVAGPVWATAPDVAYPVIYIALHDDRTPERRTTAGVVPYDWIFRIDPFAGTIEPVAASQDSQSEGPIGLVANDHYLAMSYGCCATYEVDSFDLTKPTPALTVLSRPPAQAAFFTEGIVSGDSSLIAVRAAGTGAWYWLNAEAGMVHPFPLKLEPDDGPIAISPDGTMAAVALPSQGALIEPINSNLPVATPSPSVPASAPATTPSPSPSPTSRAPKKVNSRLLHPDGLAWSPDGSQLAIAINGEIELYKADAPDGPLGPESTHPRAFGSMARLLGTYARDEKLFTLEEAVRKVTSGAARRLGLSDRGLLRPGMMADVVVFDPAKVKDLATYARPKQFPEGIETVLVNGQPVLVDGVRTEARPGRPLLHPVPDGLR